MKLTENKVAIIADIHANYKCFRNVLNDIEKLNIQTILFLGDYITDGFENNEVLDIVKKHKYVIAGNRDLSIANYNGNSWDNLKQFKNMLYTYNDISLENLEYIKTLPSYKIITIYGKKICLSHGTPYKANELVYHDSFKIFDRLINEYSADAYLFGHMHQAYCTSYKDKLFINPGSIVLPADSSSSKYGILNLSNMCYEQKSIKYNPISLRNYYIKNPNFLQNREWYNILIHTNETGIDYICAFIYFIEEKASKEGINIDNYIPNSLWESSFLEFMKKNKLHIF